MEKTACLSFQYTCNGGLVLCGRMDDMDPSGAEADRGAARRRAFTLEGVSGVGTGISLPVSGGGSMVHLLYTE